MATKHGNRVYIQVLLEPFRGELFIKEAEAKDIKPSALVRKLVYDYVAKCVGEEQYAAAVAKDEEKWQEAIKARTEGKAEMRRTSEERINRLIAEVQGRTIDLQQELPD